MILCLAIEKLGSLMFHVSYKQSGSRGTGFDENRFFRLDLFF